MFDIKKYLAENRIILNEDPKDFEKGQFRTQGDKQIRYIMKFNSPNAAKQSQRDFEQTKNWTAYNVSGTTAEFIVNHAGVKRFESLFKQYYPNAKIVKKFSAKSQDYEI